jgi:hypothetical protein
MMDEPDDYEVFLETWEPSKLLVHTSLPQNLEDPFSRGRLLGDMTGEADVTRTSYQRGTKLIGADEARVRACPFFEEHQPEWSDGLRDYVISRGVPVAKFDAYATAFASHWVDGAKRRQHSPDMLAIRASIRDFDRSFHRAAAGKYLRFPVSDIVQPLFTPTEMDIIFEGNSGLIEAYLSKYVDVLDGAGPSTISGLYVRRGVKMPQVDAYRIELSELSSYSLGIGAVEQFAQQHTDATEHTGIQSIFSAPLPAVQNRIVAFAPFIAGMDLRQLELVVAPPVEETPFVDQGEYGGIREYGFL